MPKVQEYLPEEGAAAPQGGTSPNLEAVGMYGRGIQHFGEQVTQGVDTIMQRQAQSEISDANAAAMNARAEFQERIRDETDRGTLDVAKIQDQYQDFVDKQSDAYSTPGGKNTFNRLAARTEGAILRSAARGKAQIDGNNARLDLQTTLNKGSNLVEQDPLSFEDVRSQVFEGFQASMDHGDIPPAQQRVLQQQLDTELSKGAVRGWAKQDYQAVKEAVIANGGQDVDTGAPQFNKALKMLDGGGFDDFLDSDKKKALRGEIEAQKRLGIIEGKRVLAQNDEDKQNAQEQYLNKNFIKIRMGQVSLDQIDKSPLDYKQKMAVADMVEKQADRLLEKSDPVVVNDITRRIIDDKALDHIDSPLQLLDYGKQGSLSSHDFERLSALIDKTPEGQANRTNEKMLFDLAKAKLVKTNTMAGIQDPDGEYNFMQFMNAYQSARKDAVAKGQDVKSLTDPTSPSFFGNKLQQYQLTPQQIMQKQAEQMRSQSGVTPTLIPGQPAYQPSPKSAAAMAAAIRRGEVPAQGTEPAAATTPATVNQAPSEINLGKKQSPFLGTPPPPSKSAGSPPPGLSFDQFKAWKKEHGGK